MKGNWVTRGGVFGNANRGTSATTGSGLGGSALEAGWGSGSGSGSTKSGVGSGETGSDEAVLVIVCCSSLLGGSQDSVTISVWERPTGEGSEVKMSTAISAVSSSETEPLRRLFG